MGVVTAVLLVIALSAVVGCNDGFIRGVVKSERGFDGAVRVVSERASGDLGVVTVEVPYRDVRGELKKGQARLFVTRDLLECGTPIPPFCHVHYEKDQGGAEYWCRRGWLVTTAHYSGAGGHYPIDPAVADGYNLAKAILQWVRRLPIVDRTRLHIDGGSQGGYMALVMSADCFPVSATTADCPVVNWSYNLEYFEANKAASQWPMQNPMESPLPVLCSVTMLKDWACETFGDDLSADSWYYMSPVAQVDCITNPVLIVAATGDMLVPIEQMTRAYVRPYDAARFPENYRRAFDELTPCQRARVTFEDALPDDEVFIGRMPLQKDSFELTVEHFMNPDTKPSPGPAMEERPWSPDHQWSLCYLDEGGPSPQGSHTSYEWATRSDSFVEAHRERALALESLTGAKLQRLMERYVGERTNVPSLADGRPANRLSFPVPERLDVITGLLDYAALGEAYAERLAALYVECPLRPLGESVDVATLEALRQTIL